MARKRKRGWWGSKRVTYNGVKFRSKLESYVAKRFDKHSIIWEYEPLVHLGKRWCWPDFYLPEYDVYVEVRPKKRVDDKLQDKIAAILEHHGKTTHLIHHQREVETCLVPLLTE